MPYRYQILLGAVALAGCVAPPAAPSGGTVVTGVPTIDKVRTLHRMFSPRSVVMVEFRFHAPAGNVRMIHREITATNRQALHFDREGRTAPGVDFITDSPVAIDAPDQIRGAVYLDRWQCAPVPYFVSLRAVLITNGGILSNPVPYTIHCNGG